MQANPLDVRHLGAALALALPLFAAARAAGNPEQGTVALVSE